MVERRTRVFRGVAAALFVLSVLVQELRGKINSVERVLAYVAHA